MNLLELQSDPAAFRNALLIDTDSGPRPFGQVMDSWQRKDFAALDSGWQRAAHGQKEKAAFQRAWLERPRGHSKSLDIGVMAAWALFASRRRLSGIAAAGDQDQARLLRDAIAKLTYCNAWLASILEVQNYRVINTRTESTLAIISSDAPTSYGLTPDFIIADELVHWPKRDLWDALISSAPKRSTSMVVVITNAGLSDDWAWNTREAVRSDPKWYFSRLDGPQASWITADLLAEQERLLPSVAYRRLWLNQWTSGGGDALTEEDINAAFDPTLKPMLRRKDGWEFVAGLDLGVSRDASAICVLGINHGLRTTRTSHGKIQLAHARLWRPPKKGKVDLGDIERELAILHGQYQFRTINFDPWQATHMSQRLALLSLPMNEVPPTGKNLQAIATAVIEAFNDRRVALYEHADLRRDLIRFRVEERSYGFRLVSPRDEYGHGDLGTAFSHAMLAASIFAGRVRRAGVVRLDESSDDPSEAEYQRLIRRQKELAEEAERAWQAAEDPDAEWRAFMRLMGRC